MAFRAIVDLGAMGNVAGVAGQRPEMAVVRVPRQEIGQLGDMLLRNMALHAHRIIELDWCKAAVAVSVVISGNEINSAGDLSAERIVVAVLALHTGFFVDVVEVAAGEI